MSEFINVLKKRNINSFKNYIRQIRFPFFKKLKKGSSIDFDFPFTVLVGQNGSGKSSTLQALYGCPATKNVAHYWFSTAIDPIEESGDEAYRYIYKYKPASYHSEVEIIQTRAKRSKTDKQKENPDNWETARPRRKDAMAVMPEYDEKYKHLRNETRWKKMEKDVVYIDFRAELSAFDKFFYFGTYKKRDSINSPQSFLRYRSAKLNSHIAKFKDSPLTWHSRHTNSITYLAERELKWVNRILGKQYLAAKIIKHNFFNNDGYSIIFSNSGGSYSEAVAGSGEVSVVNCVTKVLNAKKDSLILLDEPEVSLHPGAQLELRNLLLEAIKVKSCQVVMSTHSEHFVQDLPNNAIKLFQYDNVTDSYSILNECSPEQAFIRLGSELHTHHKKIYVEDILAKELVQTAIKEIDPESLNSYKIIPYPGGAETIIDNLLIHFTVSETENRDIVLLDGDMLQSIHSDDKDSYSVQLKTGKVFVKQFSSDVPESLHQDIDEIIRQQIGRKGDSFKLPLNGGNADNKEQKLKFKLKMLDIYHEKFRFMNVDTPEEFIWEIAQTDNIMNIDEIKNQYSSGTYKERFRDITNAQFDGVSDAKRILDMQLAFLNKRNTKHPLWVTFKERLQTDLKLEQITI